MVDRDLIVEIAIADRRSAIDAVSGLAKWGLATSLLLNGAGLAALANAPQDPGSQGYLYGAGLAFLTGIIAALVAGISAMTSAILFVKHANETIEAGKPIQNRSYWIKYLPALLMQVAFTAAVLSFILGVAWFAKGAMHRTAVEQPSAIELHTKAPGSR